MGKDTMELISIAAATPGQVEAFRYQDGGMERNIQDEFDARLDHIYVARVVNWPIANESDFGVSGWTPTDSLLLYLSSNNLFVTKGLAYMGGRHLEAGGELFSTDDPATDTYYVYLKYTFSSDTFEYEYATSEPTDTNLVKHLMLGTADWSTVTKFWTAVVDLRSSNTSLGAPATVSGSDAGYIFTVENTGAGGGLLVKDTTQIDGATQIGKDGTPATLTLWGTTTTGLTIYEDTNNYNVEMVCSAADTLKIQTVADGDAELIVKTLNGMVMASGVVTTGEWQATVIAKAYLAAHDHTAIGEGGDYAWADVTGFGGEPGTVSSGTSGQAGTATTASRGDHNHDLGVHDHKSAGAGGDFAWADITGFGASGTATTVSRTDHDLASHSDVSLDGATHETLHAYGSSNGTWINCPLEMWRNAGQDVDYFEMTPEGRVTTANSNASDVFYSVPLPTNRGGKKLYINGTRISLSKADSSDYVTLTSLMGYSNSGYVYMDDDPIDKNTIGLHEDITMIEDCSSYHAVKVNLQVVTTTPGDLEIQLVTVRYYYA